MAVKHSWEARLVIGGVSLMYFAKEYVWVEISIGKFNAMLKQFYSRAQSWNIAGVGVRLQQDRLLKNLESSWIHGGSETSVSEIADVGQFWEAKASWRRS